RAPIDDLEVEDGQEVAHRLLLEPAEVRAGLEHREYGSEGRDEVELTLVEDGRQRGGAALAIAQTRGVDDGEGIRLEVMPPGPGPVLAAAQLRVEVEQPALGHRPGVDAGPAFGEVDHRRGVVGKDEVARIERRVVLRAGGSAQLAVEAVD